MSRGTRQNPAATAAALAPTQDAAQRIVDLELQLAAVTAERDELAKLIKPTAAWFDVTDSDGGVERVKLTGPSLKLIQARNPGATFRGFA